MKKPRILGERTCGWRRSGCTCDLVGRRPVVAGRELAVLDHGGGNGGRALLGGEKQRESGSGVSDRELERRPVAQCESEARKREAGSVSPYDRPVAMARVMPAAGEQKRGRRRRPRRAPETLLSGPLPASLEDVVLPRRSVPHHPLPPRCHPLFVPPRPPSSWAPPTPAASSSAAAAQSSRRGGGQRRSSMVAARPVPPRVRLRGCSEERGEGGGRRGGSGTHLSVT
ncbi:hypothetical protein U9M48_038836 [Paspalum notatum var. saurae]|uniref:Uncharacterized protein n=1 Tax=Paspalum notatum var. saurae TaxID=547442 RepID=A0AAQ3XAR9_PASNO